MAAECVGLGRGPRRPPPSYARERHQFGKPIAEFQLIKGKLADDVRRDRGVPRAHLPGGPASPTRAGRELTLPSSAAKLLGAEVAMRVTTEAVQILGGYGYIDESPVERFMRDAKLMHIGGGTSEIQQHHLPRALAGARDGEAITLGSASHGTSSDRNARPQGRHPPVLRRAVAEHGYDRARSCATSPSRSTSARARPWTTSGARTGSSSTCTPITWRDGLTRPHASSRRLDDADRPPRRPRLPAYARRGARRAATVAFAPRDRALHLGRDHARGSRDARRYTACCAAWC